MGAHGVGDVTVQAIDDAAARRLSNLPDLLSSFIGRQAEIDEVAALVADHRLVTVTGPGGGGKTRLAHRVAIDLIPAFPDGVWWVELAGLTAPAGIGPAVARTLGIHDDLSGDIAGQLADRRMLLVLDNCEHLLSGAAEMVHRVLASCPQVQVLATSRIALAVPGEVTWRIPAMVMPRRDDVTADDAVACDAVALFVVRARSAGYDVALHDPDEIRAVVEMSADSTRCRWRSSWPRRAAGRSESPRSSTPWAMPSRC